MSYVTYIGLLAAFLTSMAFFPQVVKAFKSKHTKDISLIMILMQFTGLVCWLVYGLLISDIPLIASNIMAVTLALILLLLKIKHG